MAPHIKFAICNEIFQGWKIDEVLAYVAKLGYHGVEIAPFTLADDVRQISAEERRRIRRLAAEHRIQLVGLHWLLVKPEGLYVNHPDRDIRKRTSDYFCALVDFCADLGGTRLVLGSPKQRQVMSGVSVNQARDWGLETLAYPVARAERRRVTICFEPLGPAETNFINTAAEAIEFTKRLPSSRLKIILDVKAMSTESKPIPQIIRESWSYVAHFHANDPNLKGPGFGAMDFKPIAAALKEVGYKEFVSVEVFNFEEGPEAIASRSLDYLRKTFD